MKNHWIQHYEKKKKKIWTSEFSKNGLFSLKARRVDVIDSSMASGSVSIIFKDAMYSVGDKELMDFLAEAHRKGLSGHISRLRVYQGISVELENYELTGLSYGGMLSRVDDIQFTFMFNHMRHYHVS